LSQIPPNHAFLRTSVSFSDTRLCSISQASFLILVSFPVLDTAPIPALVDCAASDIFIDPSFASQFTSTLNKKLLVPRHLTLFDGTPSSSGPITDALYTEVVFGKNF
jgi:hypothetical protein